MRIAVLGSWRPNNADDWPLRGTKQGFDVACNEIGKELAKRQQIVVLGAESKNTADAHIVDGVISVGGAVARPLIEVLRPADDSQAYRDLAATHPKLFTFPPSTQIRWANTNLIQIRNADAVLAIGGGDGTYQAGMAAIVAKKLLVPIGAFGGAAAKLLEALRADNVPFSQELGVLNGPWTSNTLETAMRLLGVDRQPRLLLIHGHSADRHILTDWLRVTLGLADILIMREEFGAGRSLPEKFESLAAHADGAIAIATPDDLGGVADGTEKKARARQNVWLEVGWIWGRLGRNKVMVLSKGDIDIPSDLQGLEHYQYKESPLERTEAVRAFMNQLVGSRQ